MMSDAQVHKVRFEPVGIEMEVEEGETVLNAAFRQGISLMHGCKEGQCGSCKSKLVDGDIELLKYSTFALPDYESETGHVLLCRTHAYSDVCFELLNYDEDLLSRSIAVKAFAGHVAAITALTSDIRLLEIETEKPMKFWAGPVRRPDDRRRRHNPRILDGESAQRWYESSLHHQEISQRRVFVAARWRARQG